MKEVRVKLFTEVTWKKKGVFRSAFSLMSAQAYLDIQSCKLAGLRHPNNIKRKHTFLANGSEVCDFINKHTSAWANGTRRMDPSSPPSTQGSSRCPA